MKFIIACMLLFAFGQVKTQSTVIFEDEYVEVYFDNQMDIEELVDIKQKLSERDIQLDFMSLTFNDNGLLEGISFNVDCKDGNTGTAARSFLADQESVGFYRSFSEGASPLFGTGVRTK